MKGPRPILDDDEVDELTMGDGKSGAPHPIARRLGSEFDEVAPARALAPDERPTRGSRPPVNGDTLNVPIDSSGLTQLAEQTKRLLEAKGFECATMPSKVALQIWKLGDASAELTRWKRKLKDSFGVRSSTTVRKLDGIDPSRRNNEDIDDEDDDDDYASRDYADPCEDLAAQVRRSYHHEDGDGAQRIKLTHHISLSKVSKFNGTRNRSERSLRWLKKFIYEMEGTNTPQDRWCEPFQLCMEGCASNWIRQLPKKTRSKWSRLCEAFMAYYCSQGRQAKARQGLPPIRTPRYILQQFNRTRPPTVTGLGIDGLPELSEPAVETNFVFAFVKRSEWQEDTNAKDFGCEQDGGSCPVEASTILKPSEEVGELTGVITSAPFRERSTSARVETRRLLKGERRG
ncbi:unnamed protein product [Phytophthora fragariaefolia]|uniref:Unnamed protein product n=1 Tax=Phytophthora fragariaefolia TaxID=1490495 RepID=A0A9W6XDA6_9STRA|nr:unnamed protein product [Phytophthora fragariaefolia]